MSLPAAPGKPFSLASRSPSVSVLPHGRIFMARLPVLSLDMLSNLS